MLRCTRHTPTTRGTSGSRPLTAYFEGNIAGSGRWLEGPHDQPPARRLLTVFKIDQTPVAESGRNENDKNNAMKNPWFGIGINAWLLGIEACSVIGLRALKIAGGGVAAEAEARLMINEKIEAGWTLQGKAFSGALGLTAHRATAKTLVHYRRKVRANQRRLTKQQSAAAAR
jgi:hypothetical protein